MLNRGTEGAIIARIYLFTTGHLDVNSFFLPLFWDGARLYINKLQKQSALHAVRATLAHCRTSVNLGRS